MSKSCLAALLCVGLVACGNSANGQQPAPGDTQSIASADVDAAAPPSKTETGPKWVTGESPMKTSIGELTWTSSYDDAKPCLLINGKAALGQDDISCLNVDVAVLDYGNAITIIAVSNGGGASSLPYYNIVHVDHSNAPTAAIEFGAPDDGYEPNWKQQGDLFVSDPFEQDGKSQYVQLLPSDVQLVTQSISKNEAAPIQLCTFMKEALSTYCKEPSDCNHIVDEIGNMPSSWFRTAETDPRFNYQGFMSACRSSCEGSKPTTKGFEKLYCNAH